jgi:hypothetical protein
MAVMNMAADHGAASGADDSANRAPDHRTADAADDSAAERVGLGHARAAKSQQSAARNK